MRNVFVSKSPITHL